MDTVEKLLACNDYGNYYFLFKEFVLSNFTIYLILYIKKQYFEFKIIDNFFNT